MEIIMYISKLIINNFRIFEEKEIEFNEKMNVIIGPNNSGKSTLLTALRILFDKQKRGRLSVDDFNKNINLEEVSSTAPKIKITAVFSQSSDEKEFSVEMIPIATWLTEISDNYEARLTYEFFLPEKYESEYREKFEKYNITDNLDYWNFLEKEFIKKYVYKLYGGNEEYKNVAEWDDLSKFDFQFLSAIRDVEKDLSTGKKTLLKEVLEFFTDFDIKNNPNWEKNKKTEKIREKSKEFIEQSDKLFKMLDDRLKSGKYEILRYIRETGASIDDIKPDFIGKITEKEFYSHMFLIVDDENNIKLPVELNGLGYNNLLYISLILAKIQKDSDIEYLGDNAKSYSILSIEEPEAHLHPNMQYKFLKFLKNNQEENVNQIFITSHSPNITSAVELDHLIVLDKQDKKIDIFYPYKAFNDDVDSKKYIERFLDVTKSDMFFAKKLIFVEGLAEQLLIPILSKYEKYDLFDHHVSIINANGRHFGPFLKLFNPKNGGINKKVVCITDKDPQKKKIGNSKWKGCYNYELNLNSGEYEYNESSNPLFGKYEDIENIKVKMQENSHTFEYELILSNISCTSLLTEKLTHRKNIKELMDIYSNSPDNFDEIFQKVKCTSKNKLHKRIIKNESLTPEEKSEHIIATRFYKSLEKNKGEYAQELVNILFNNLNDETFEFTVPEYICEAIEWLQK